MDLRKPLLHFLSEVHLPPTSLPNTLYHGSRIRGTHRGTLYTAVEDNAEMLLMQVPERASRIWECPAAAAAALPPCVPRKAYPVLNLDPPAEQLALHNTPPYRLQLVLRTVAYQPAALEMSRRPG